MRSAPWKADASHVAGEPIGIGLDSPDRPWPVGLVDAHRPRGAQAVAVQEQNDAADRLLLGESLDDALRPPGTHPLHATQGLGLAGDHVEDALAEKIDEAAGADGADSVDETRPQVPLQPLGAGRCRDGQRLGAELDSI
jgi:hypothetical protein